MLHLSISVLQNISAKIYFTVKPLFELHPTCPPPAGIRVKLRNEKTNKIGLIVFAIIAPKGRNKIAQGNALGLAL